MKRLNPLRIMSLFAVSLALATGFTLVACSPATSGSSDAADASDTKQGVNTAYDFQNPTVHKLPDDLREISGITFQAGDARTLYAQQDENGLVYTFSLPTINPKIYPIAKDGDYEDIALNSSHLFMLRSNGTILSLPIAALPTSTATTAVEQSDLLPKEEYEGMAFSTDLKQLIVLCKVCKIDRKSNALTAYSFQVDAQGKLSQQSPIQIDYTNFKGEKAFKKTALKPSALAQHPETKEWYIISSINKAIVITDENWQVKQVVALPKAHFPQPEGIAFDKDNNLFISNESPDKVTAATLLQFTYSKF